jgi:putative ABC transport system permease protein
MAELVSDSEARRRFAVVLLSVFAGVALLLAIIGIYGVISDSVNQRRHEIGIRMALGARAPHVLGLMMTQGMMPALIGIGVGLVACLGATRLLSSMLFGVAATDPATLAVAAGVIGLVALVASYLPARRAMRVDPMVALRVD